MAVMRNVARLPIFCPIVPTDMAPITVPQRAIDTVKPRFTGLRKKRSESACVVPAMTAVSKPNSKPPSAPVTALRRRYLLRITLDLPPFLIGGGCVIAELFGDAECERSGQAIHRDSWVGLRAHESFDGRVFFALRSSMWTNRVRTYHRRNDEGFSIMDDEGRSEEHT